MISRPANSSGTPLDDATLDEATAHYARARESESARPASALVFRIGTEWLALSAAVLDRVAAVQRVHSLPHRRGGTAAGLVNVGGDLVVHVSLGGLLHIAPSAASAAQPRLVVLWDARGRLATTVDEVWGIHHHDVGELRALPPTFTRSESSFTTAILQVGGHGAGYLDAERVMDALSMGLA